MKTTFSFSIYGYIIYELLKLFPVPLNFVNSMDTEQIKQCNKKSNEIIKIVLQGYYLTLCYKIDRESKTFLLCQFQTVKFKNLLNFTEK